MIKFELVKVNESFDSLKFRLKDRDNSLASLYEALLPWKESCREEDYPELYRRFVEEGEDFNSWKEIEERLPQLTLIENSDNKIVLAGDDALSNHLFMLRLAIINGSNLTLTSDGKLVEVNTNPDTLAYVYKFYNINYSFSENKMTLEHFNP